MLPSSAGRLIKVFATVVFPRLAAHPVVTLALRTSIWAGFARPSAENRVGLRLAAEMAYLDADGGVVSRVEVFARAEHLVRDAVRG